MVPTFPLVDGVFPQHLILLWNSSKSREEIAKRFEWKSYEICKNFNVSYMMLMNVFQLLEYIKLNMVKVCAMAFGFSKDNPRNSLTPLVQ
jgi:hypothetical protein